MIRDLPPDLKLLGALAALALLVALAMVAGLGRQAGLLADDPSLLAPLPDVTDAPQIERIGERDAFAEIWERPLFQPDRRPAPIAAMATDDTGNSGFEPLLTGVLVAGDLRVAVVQDTAGTMPSRHVRLGDPIPDHPDWRLVALDAREATFDSPSGRRSVPLRSYDGAGSGQARRAGMGVVRAMAEPEQVAEADGTEERPPDVRATPQQSEEEVVEAIRRRIEARRQALREQSASQSRQER